MAFVVGKSNGGLPRKSSRLPVTRVRRAGHRVEKSAEDDGHFGKSVADKVGNKLRTPWQ
jgi:hypothetical protein